MSSLDDRGRLELGSGWELRSLQFHHPQFGCQAVIMSIILDAFNWSVSPHRESKVRTNTHGDWQTSRQWQPSKEQFLRHASHDATTTWNIEHASHVRKRGEDPSWFPDSLYCAQSDFTVLFALSFVNHESYSLLQLAADSTAACTNQLRSPLKLTWQNLSFAQVCTSVDPLYTRHYIGPPT